MGVQKLLAKLTAGTINLMGSSGGIPAITAAELNAAMGYAQRDVTNAAGCQTLQKLKTPTGSMIVMARYADDKKNLQMLKGRLPRQVYYAWWNHNTPDSETISKLQMRRLARVLADDYCEVPLHDYTTSYIAHTIGIDVRTYKRKLARFYGEQKTVLSGIEADFLQAFKKRLFEQIS